MDEQTSLIALFTSSFLAATLLPGGSEAVLVSVLLAYPELHWQALVLATIGNTLGGMSSYLIGRFLPSEQAMHEKIGKNTRGLRWINQYGAPILLLSWAPLIGDILCVAAGWLRINWLSAAIFMAIGKFLRYWVIATAIH
ncbi:membrane protein YqaA, SNARE-associated domain [Nitrosomonas sp. PY1]|uniref:YqaA family protein n=1 Tax=Nitrosomonas sp. PY1 TaxID=1803906 RepID=UPI001FC8777F|nr:YqaA family protein [Nitrosomonas sp. PY1]GKS68526.1 membrane protein YqaA, SNARE-associated domain [Nitrosomonas sp. PY1]